MAEKNIHVADDEEDILELIQYNLAREGYQITGAVSGEEALEKARTKSFDLIILDFILPGTDVLDVSNSLKSKDKTLRTPIVMLSSKGEQADVVTGLELSPDEYITKPFSLSILVARIRAALRHKTSEAEDGTSVITIHDLEIHPHRRSVTAGGKQIDLTYTEFQVLYILARRPGCVYTRSQIVHKIRGSGYPVTDRSVDVQIVGLRKKLGKHGKHIETVRGVGYRFVKSS